MRTTLRASADAVAALDARAAAADAERAEREREFAARPPAQPRPALAVVKTDAPAKPKKPPPRPRSPGPWKPHLTWAAGIPIVFPCDYQALGDREQQLTDSTYRTMARIVERRPGDASRMAAKLEAYLGVSMADRAAVWAPVRALLADLGTQALADDVRELAGVKVKRQRGQSTKAKKARKQTVKHSDGATPERAKKSRLVEEPIYAVDPATPRPERKGREDAMPTPKMILLGRAMRDKSLDPKTRLERFKRLETQHIAAGVRFAADWERAALEPCVTANMLATGGGGSSTDAWTAGLNHSVMKARDNVHAAIKALSAGGLDVVHVVQAVILNGETATVAASGTYTDKPRASTHVATNLKAGLNLLDRHYNPPRSKDRHDRASEETS